MCLSFSHENNEEAEELPAPPSECGLIFVSVEKNSIYALYDAQSSDGVTVYRLTFRYFGYMLRL
jgi:hypothetical protein